MKDATSEVEDGDDDSEDNEDKFLFAWNMTNYCVVSEHKES